MLFLDDLRRLPGAHLVYSGFRPRLRGACIDSRALHPGDLFFALKGERFDGHEFLPQVLARKAAGCVVTPDGFERHRGLLKTTFSVIVDNPLEALQQLALLHRRRFPIPILAIAGSNGKTGTKDLVAHVLSSSYRVLQTQGNLNNHLGVPLTLLRLTARHELAVLELGTNHFGELATLCRLSEPTHGLLTCIGREHLEYFKNLRGVARAEFELYTWLAQHGGFAFGLGTDSYIKAYLHSAHSPFPRLRQQLYACMPPPLERGRVPLTKRLLPSNWLLSQNQGFDSRLRPLLAFFHRRKALFQSTVGALGQAGQLAATAAVSVGLHFGLDHASMARRLSNFKSPSSKRLQLSRKRKVLFLNDAYNSNPDSLRMGLDTVFAFPCRGRKHLVLSDMLELGTAGPGEHRACGRYLRIQGHRRLYGYGPLTKELCRAAGSLEVNEHFADKAKLVAALKKDVRPGELVYLKGSRGMRLEEVLDLF